MIDGSPTKVHDLIAIDNVSLFKKLSNTINQLTQKKTASQHACSHEI